MHAGFPFSDAACIFVVEIFNPLRPSPTGHTAVHRAQGQSITLAVAHRDPFNVIKWNYINEVETGVIETHDIQPYDDPYPDGVNSKLSARTIYSNLIHIYQSTV